MMLLMERVLKFLANDEDYDVPERNLAINFAQVPIAPNSRFGMQNVRLKNDPVGVETG